MNVLPPDLLHRTELEAEVRQLRETVRDLQGRLTLTQQTAATSAESTRVLANRVRNADAYLAGVASTMPELAAVYADVRTLLAGGMH